MATAAQVTQAYFDILGRPPDPAGLAYYTTGEGAAKGIDQIRADFNYAVQEKLEAPALVTSSDVDQFNNLVASGKYPEAAQFAASKGVDPAITADYINQNAANLGLPSDFRINASNVSSLVPPAARGDIETITIQPRDQITIDPVAIANIARLDPANTLTVNRGTTTSPTTLESGAMGPYASAPSATPEEITASYTRFLNRTPGQEEINFWTNYSRTNDPTQTAEAFINSARKEIGDIMKSGYTSYLGREPTQDELDFWTNYTIQNDAVQAANAWKAGANEELARRKTVSDVDTTLQKSNLTGSLVSESTAGIPYGGGIYKRTPREEEMYREELSRIPVSTAVPLPVMPMSIGPSAGLTRARQPGDIGEDAYYANIRKLVSSSEYTPAQLRQMQRNVGTSGQDINVAMGTGMTPITTTTPTMPGAAAGTTQSIGQFIQSKAPTSSVAMPTAPSMFSPENVAAQLELERLRLKPTPEKPVAGFAQGGLVGDDINRMLQNQRNAIQRESQSRQMLTSMGAPPVKKFSNGGPAGSSSGVRRLEMSGYQEGGEVTDDDFIQEMMTGTRPTDETTSPGILPPELRSAIDVPLDLANLAIRGTAGAVAGPAYGLYKGITGGKYGTREGVTEARSEAERMMGEITGEPKTQAARDITEYVGEKLEAAKIPPMPQFLTTPAPGPGAAAALMRSYELAETPPVGGVKLAGDKGAKLATPPTDQMGFYSPAEKAVMGLPQDKGTASQMLAQITKTQGVKPVELRATGLDEFLKSKGDAPVTKQEIQDFLTSNRVAVDEVVLGRGLSMSPEAKRLMEDAEKRMMKADQVMAPFFEQQEAGSLLQGQEPYSTFYRIRGPLSRKIAKGDQEALAELDALNLPPDIRQAVLDFGSAKLDYQKHSKPARFEQKPKFDGYNIPGGQNAREIYLTLPGEQMPSSLPPSVNAQGVLVKPMYATQPKFTAPPQHSVSPEADANRLAHIFLDERKDAKGDKVLFVQEMQSDWAQIGKKKGFQTKTTPYDDPEYKAARARATDLLNEFNRNNANPVRQQEIAPLLEEARRVEQSFGDNRQRLPAAPFVTNTEDWVNLALKRVIKEAVDNDIDTVAFIKGGQAADKYSLRTFVDQITADRGFATGDDLYVSITPKNSLSPHVFYVGPDGVIKEPISADVRSKFLGEPLSKVIGKEAAEKLLSTEVGKSQILRDEGLTLGGKGMEGFYDNILPKTAEKLLKKLGGGKVEPVEVVKGAPSQMPFEANTFLDWMEQNHPGTSRSDAARAWGMGMDNNQFVKEFYEATKADQYLGFKITPEMKEMVKTEGLPKFAAGGEVTDFIKRAA